MHSSKKKPSVTVREQRIEEIVQSYLQGNQNKFKEIHEYLLPVINQVLHTKKYPGYLEHIEDIKQECWLDAVKNLPLWDPARGTLKNFMFKCFANRTLVYLHRVESTRTFVQIEELAEVLPAQNVNVFVDELDIELPTRFFSEKDQLIIRRVCITVYLRTFNSIRNKIIKDLRQWTGYSVARIRFLVDYALVLIRKHCLENGWRIEETLAAS